MGLIEKLKLLFKIQKPAGDVVQSLKDAKTGWKTLAFWVTLLGSLLATAAALTGIIPAPAQLVAVTALTAAYNILRGAQKAESSEIKGTFRTTEVVTTALGEIQKALVAIHTGGINPAWLTTASTVVGMALAAGQNLAAQNVNAGAVAATPPSN